jgi:hypothetical protein
VLRLGLATALAGTVSACAAITGLDAYSKGDCADCDAGANDGAESGSADGPEAPLDSATVDAEPSDDVADATALGDATVLDAASGADTSGEPQDAADSADAPDAAGCEGGACTATTYACDRGGCNAEGGFCASGGQSCACFADSQCLSGRCVPVAGQNDLSCATNCTGSGPGDGFGCELASPGIPSVAPRAFPYTPHNFAPASYTPPASATLIDCNTTYSSTTHAFIGFCADRVPPTIVANVAQTGGPAADVLAFAGLTVAAGSTLTVAPGGNAVVFAIYGSAAIHGTIHADGSSGASGTTTPGASGAGGAYSCGTSTGTSQPADGACSGGAGAGASKSGGAGAGGVGGNTAAGGAARALTISPLYGGCPGGTSGSWACRTSGGGGGGALQISASGLLWFDGLITANGGAGGTSTCFAHGCGLDGYGGGGGGGGSGGTVLIEAQSVLTVGAAVLVNGGPGGNPDTTGGGGPGPGGLGGSGGSLLSMTGAPGTGSSLFVCGPYSSCGGGGGGSYGNFVVTGVNPSPCMTSLSPAPALSTNKAACQCVADSDCASGRCVDQGQCTGSCTGAGTADVTSCEVPLSHACSQGDGGPAGAADGGGCEP